MKTTTVRPFRQKFDLVRPLVADRAPAQLPVPVG